MASVSLFSITRPLAVISFAAVIAVHAGSRPAPPHTENDEQPIRFNRDVRPLLSDRCFPCHGPDQQKSRLRLDRTEGADGAFRIRGGSQAIKPGSLEESELWYRITTEDEFDAMPPADSHKARLNAEELETVRRWILKGAPYENHWAFVAPAKPELPTVRSSEWSKQPIDGFVLHKLESLSLSPQPQADKRTLIRRLTFDLTGLPPTRTEIATFLNDQSANAYEILVDRLLSSPQYGEHMAKYWLDLVRFADTNGIHHDHFRDMSPYRDWVIRSFNDNLPYDQFVTDQIAGDLRASPTQDQIIASGFHRLHLIIDRGTALPEESHTRNVIDRVTAFGTAFLGLTVQCASCHDHKYDPIKQEEFYELYAFFNNLDAQPETGGRSGSDFKRGLQPPYIDLPSQQQSLTLQEFEIAKDAVEKKIQGLKQKAKIQGNQEDSKLPEEITQAQDDLKTLQKEQQKVLLEVRAAMVMKERNEIRPTHVLIRGDYQTPGKQVERTTPDFLPPISYSGEAATRLDLARWLVKPEHPLTARVAVNRFWQQLFGVGLVKTAEDFGAQGEWPSHPELLDYLSVTFLESGWDVKALLRLIVLSATYQQSSAAPAEEFAKDPGNRHLTRGSRFRMDSEMIRDQILATSGLLNSTMYGASVKPPQPLGVWKAVTLPDSYPRTFTPDKGDKIYRRSIYTFWKRGLPPPQMTILNAPTREFCTARRERTNTPLQALLLMNEHEYLKAARHLAADILRKHADAQDRLHSLYETITSYVPDALESKALLQFVKEMQEMYAESPSLADELCGDFALESEGPTVTELAAWTMLASTIYNLDITKTRQ